MVRQSSSSSPSLLVLAAALLLLSLLAATHPALHVHAFQQQPLSPHTPTTSRRHGRRGLLPLPSSHAPPTSSSPWALAAQSSSSGGGGIDGLFRLIRNDALSLTIGSLCLVALVANRLATPDLYDSQSRTDIIGVISAGGLLLNGLTLQVRPMCSVVMCR